MQIRTIRKELKHLNANSNYLKGIWSIRMQIRTIRKGIKAFECKFEPFEMASKHSNANSNRSKGIWSIRMQILTIQKGFEAFVQIRAIRNGFEPFECKF